ncbi:unnamed protein product [Peronospora farinosa]|uniref:Uncharacterized protein n=1 Tax=Peronospora farinosa TaxID=134698 RepID=A0AAV0TDL3_9STRA|nr:unnamed protein product [Peronospora farinosa]
MRKNRGIASPHLAEDKMLADTLFDVLAYDWCGCYLRKRKLEQESVGVSDAQFDMIVMMLQDNPGRASQYGTTPALVSQMKANREAKKTLDVTTEDKRMNNRPRCVGRLGLMFTSRESRKQETLLAMVSVSSRMLEVNPLFVLRKPCCSKAPPDVAHAGDYDGNTSTAPLCVSCSS